MYPSGDHYHQNPVAVNAVTDIDTPESSAKISPNASVNVLKVSKTARRDKHVVFWVLPSRLMVPDQRQVETGNVLKVVT